jgi:hypothetical protein
MALDFDDSAWSSGKDAVGPAGGFGTRKANFEVVDIGTPEAPEKDGVHSAYFRLSFATEKNHGNLELRCQHDDGIIVYLDGEEVIRENMNDGPEDYLLPARNIIRLANETFVHRLPIGKQLAPGRHVLAISLHNVKDDGLDLRIGDISLVELEGKDQE